MPVVVVGHSLGAGTAVLLSYLLRPTFPSLCCYTYGVPGSVLDANTARECDSFVFSCVCGSDIVSRLNMQSIMRFRENVRIVTYF